MHPIFLIPLSLTVALIWLTIAVWRDLARERNKPRPTYYVRHPDDTFTEANPQP